MKNITNTLSAAWDSFLGRVAILALAIGWMPYYFLSAAHAALVN